MSDRLFPKNIRMYNQPFSRKKHIWKKSPKEEKTRENHVKMVIFQSFYLEVKRHIVYYVCTHFGNFFTFWTAFTLITTLHWLFIHFIYYIMGKWITFNISKCSMFCKWHSSDSESALKNGLESIKKFTLCSKTRSYDF